MAAARRCDRCGKFYEGGVSKMYKYTENGVEYPVNTLRIGLYNRKTKRWKNLVAANDLCPECAQTIIETIFAPIPHDGVENELETVSFESENVSGS